MEAATPVVRMRAPVKVLPARKAARDLSTVTTGPQGNHFHRNHRYPGTRPRMFRIVRSRTLIKLMVLERGRCRVGTVFLVAAIRVLFSICRIATKSALNFPGMARDMP